MSEEKKLTTAFIAAINNHELEKMVGIMADGMVFIDAQDKRITGLEENKKAWEQYFAKFPDYTVEQVTAMQENNTISITGYASGSFGGKGDSTSSFKIPLSILSKVLDGKISEWRVFSDTKIPHEIIQKNAQRDTTDLKVQGFGGVFFKAKDSKVLRDWYDKHLGTDFSSGSAYFKWRNRDNQEQIGSTSFGIFKETTDYYAPSTKPFMFNFRVNNLEALLTKLKSDGVQQVGEIDPYDYGKFAWIMDPEGNKIELWEPVDDVLEAYESKN